VRPLPQIEGPDRPFWDGLRRRQVLVQCCGQCGTRRFPAAKFCANCRSEAAEWVPVDPAGEIETWCVFHKSYFEGLEVPYAVVQVKLDCGVRLFSNPIDIANDDLRVGMRVEAAFEDITPEITLLKFRPAKEINL
jgi:uncharacterized OB-fold protein